MLLSARGELRLMRFGRIGHNRGHYARLDDDYLYEGKTWRCTSYRGIDVESMAPLTETNCVTPYRMRRHPLLYSPCFLAAASRNLSLSMQKSLSIRDAQMRV